MEEYFRRALQVSRGSPAIFVERLVSAALLAITVVLVIVVSLPMLNRWRSEAFQG